MGLRPCANFFADRGGEIRSSRRAKRNSQQNIPNAFLGVPYTFLVHIGEIDARHHSTAPSSRKTGSTKISRSTTR